MVTIWLAVGQSGMQLAPLGQTWLTRPRVVGTPARWASHAALVGAAYGGGVPTTLWLTTGLLQASRGPTGAFHPSVVVAVVLLAAISAVTAAALGGIVGLATPRFLDRVRGRWALPIVAATATVAGAAVGAAAPLGWLPFTIEPSGFASMLELAPWISSSGALVGAIATTLWWTPFTMATVLRRGWPVTRTTVIAAPAVALLLAQVLALLV
jgi:hypothetical protein